MEARSEKSNLHTCVYTGNSEHLYKDYIVIKPQKITKAYLITRGHLLAHTCKDSEQV